MTRGVRLRMRTMTYAEREGFVAVRSAVHKLRTDYWTPANWLELRLCKYIAMGVFRLGGKLFSKKQDTDGAWRSQVLVPRPSNMNRARQDQIFSHVRVPSPFRDPHQVTAAQTENSLQVMTSRFPKMEKVQASTFSKRRLELSVSKNDQKILLIASKLLCNCFFFEEGEFLIIEVVIEEVFPQFPAL
jgi:hypothetical protein